jgi:hypothetical protein
MANLLVKRVLFLSNSTYSLVILDMIGILTVHNANTNLGTGANIERRTSHISCIIYMHQVVSSFYSSGTGGRENTHNWEMVCK